MLTERQRLDKVLFSIVVCIEGALHFKCAKAMLGLDTIQCMLILVEMLGRDMGKAEEVESVCQRIRGSIGSNEAPGGVSEAAG